MSRLYQLDTYFQKVFIVTAGGNIVTRSNNWNEARSAYYDLTGDWPQEPTHDLVAELALLEGVISDAE